MPVNPEAVGQRSEPRRASWSSKDCILYALGVGAGVADPTGFELEFTTENSQDVTQRVLATFPVVVAPHPPSPEVGTFNPAMMLHGEESVTLHAPLKVEGTVESVSTVTGIYDKGSGAVITSSAVATDVDTGEPVWTITRSSFIRGEGGWGGDRGPSAGVQIPDREPDHQVTYPTRIDQALLYRLMGDRNPLHSDPKFAARAGFERPILHGLCTFGFTGRALLHTLCGSDPDRLVSMGGRFSKPVFPGEALTVSMWIVEEGIAVFQTSTPAGVVFDGGRLTYR
jgi:acyl dehydratase